MPEEEKLVLHIKLVNHGSIVIVFPIMLIGGYLRAWFVTFILLGIVAASSWYNTYRYFRAVRRKEIKPIQFGYDEHPIIRSFFLTVCAFILAIPFFE